MTFFHETLHPQKSMLKPTVISLGMMLCLSVSLPNAVMASDSIVEQQPLEEKKESTQTKYGYAPDVHDALLKRSPLLLKHDVIETQRNNFKENNDFLHDMSKAHYDDMRALWVAQKQQFLSESGLFVFDRTVDKKSLQQLETLSTEELDSIKPKDVALPKETTTLTLKNGELTSLAMTEERILKRLATYIAEKREQNTTNPLEHVAIKDLNKSVYVSTNDTNKTLDDTITSLLRDETYNVLCLLMWQRALLDGFESDVNKIVTKSNAIIEGLKSRWGKTAKLKKGSNSAKELEIYDKAFADDDASLSKLLTERKSLQEEVRSKMIQFAKLLKAPKEKTKGIEALIIEVCPVTEIFSYWSYLNPLNILNVLPSMTEHGVKESISVNVFGSRHSRSLGVDETIKPLVDTSHVRQVFAAFKKHVIKNDKALEALLLGVDVENSDAHLGLESLFKTVSGPLVEETSETRNDNVHNESDDEGVDIKPLFSDLQLSEVDVGQLAKKASEDVKSILDRITS